MARVLTFAAHDRASTGTARLEESAARARAAGMAVEVYGAA